MLKDKALAKNSINWMIGLLVVLTNMTLWNPESIAKETGQIGQVADPFIELHTGPGRGYPIFHVVNRGDVVEIIRRKTGWFKLRIASGKEGWAHRRNMEKTLTSTGEQMKFTDITRKDFAKRRWEFGTLVGDFEGATALTLYGGRNITPNLSAELSITQAIGTFSTNWIGSVNLVAHPFPNLRFSPFFTLGAGAIRTEPKTTLIQTIDRTDPTAHVGLGIRTHVAQRFVIRMEYRSHVVFSSNENNEEANEWKAGFAIFF
ncbi:hypothetical protein MNBD_GAMMA16-1562 [hydrothermal vent metagenome]|uniref:Uncharacterized protein n=1 Tax=hydrothermal vent metagenome TaxID=652676 RepID=A0A3B0Z7C6_9ZZZZ